MIRVAPALIIVAALAAGSIAGAGATAVQGNEPSPVPSSIPLTVVIPGPTTTPTPTSTPRPGGGGTTSGGGSTGGGSNGTGGESTDIPTSPGTEAPVPPNQPTDDAVDLKLDRETISAGEWMTAIGSEFTPGEKVQFVLYPGAVVIGSFVTDPSGTVVARFKITENLAPGTYTVEATGWQSKRVANGEFLVVSPVVDTALNLWWVWVVVGVLLLALLVLAFYFRDVIRGWFGGARAVPRVGSAA